MWQPTMLLTPVPVSVLLLVILMAVEFSMDLTVPVALHGSVPHLIPLRLLAVGRVRLLPVKSHPAMA